MSDFLRDSCLLYDRIFLSYICYWFVSYSVDLVALVDSFHLDFATDSIIQSSLRSELGSDVTLLTVAHRLQTIMDSDKIVSHVLRYHCQ